MNLEQFIKYRFVLPSFLISWLPNKSAASLCLRVSVVNNSGNR